MSFTTCHHNINLISFGHPRSIETSEAIFISKIVHFSHTYIFLQVSNLITQNLIILRKNWSVHKITPPPPFTTNFPNCKSIYHLFRINFTYCIFQLCKSVHQQVHENSIRILIKTIKSTSYKYIQDAIFSRSIKLLLAWSTL